jgi:hypothetical protein
MGSAVCPFENQTMHSFFHFLCDMPQDQDHLASDMFINYTAEEGALFILCVVHPQINGG